MTDIEMETVETPPKTHKRSGSLSVKLRFDVFKRDGFRCQYCGRKTPEVVLEVDHVIPVSAGGLATMENLVTSCWECNRGKGAGLLDELAPTMDPTEQAILMLERERQLAEYNHVKAMVRERQERELIHLYEYWDWLAGGKAQYYPFMSVLRHFQKVLAVEDIKEAMTIAHDRCTPYQSCKYLSGVLKNMVKEIEGE